MTDLEFLRAHLPDQRWRLNNLYHIIDESGSDVLFKMRPAQAQLYDNLHHRNVILKARQEGFTTFIDLLALDLAIFNPNYAAEINAETKPKASDIFDAKILYPYKHLPVEIQRFCPITYQTKDGTVSFGNGSSVQVDVSARSGTFQFLHVSEYGIVSAKYPGKAEEILTGSIPAVPKNGLVFIESTAKGAAGPFFELSTAAQKKALAGTSLSPLDFKFHFFPWHQHPEYRIPPGSVVVTARLREYFDMLRADFGVELDPAQQAWYAQQEAVFGDKMWSEYPSYPDEAFKVAQEGAYYAREFTKIYRENRITRVTYDPNYPVYTGWDLGISDDTAIWFLQFIGRQVNIIDYYANFGEGLPHYAKILADKPYTYAAHFAPHDIAARELGTGVSRIETARNLGIRFETIPTNRDVLGGIENTREMLQYAWIDEEKCAEGVKCLENYRKEWNDRLNCFRDRPLHDWTSHGADALRTIAVAWRSGKVQSTIVRDIRGESAGGRKLKVTRGLKEW